MPESELDSGTELNSDFSEGEEDLTAIHSDGERRNNRTPRIPLCFSEGDEAEPSVREIMNELDPIDPSKSRNKRDQVLEGRIERLVRNVQNVTELLQKSISGHEADTEDNPTEIIHHQGITSTPIRISVPLRDQRLPYFGDLSAIPENPKANQLYKSPRKHP